jgi:hypothetical protein
LTRKSIQSRTKLLKLNTKKKRGIWPSTYAAIDDSFKRRRHGSVATTASAFLLLETEAQKISRAVTNTNQQKKKKKIEKIIF